MELRYNHFFEAAPDEVFAAINDLAFALQFAQQRGRQIVAQTPRGPWQMKVRLSGQSLTITGALVEVIDNESLGFDFDAAIFTGSFDVIAEAHAGKTRISFFSKLTHKNLAGRALLQALRLMPAKTTRIFAGQLRPYCAAIETRINPA